MDRERIRLSFLKSALTVENPFIDMEGVEQWLQRQREEVSVRVDKIRFPDMEQWFFDPGNGNLRHRSGQFFSIDGLHVKTNWGQVKEWSQPIINQPEIGFLGIIAREIDGILYFLMQAKIEPGNINYVQLSPTLQATRSNYTRVHRGRKPLYLDYFLKRDRHRVLVDQLQSEQGGRFYRKRNRNVIIRVAGDEDVPVYENFAWLTLGQIKKLMQIDNTVNMDTRTVISAIPYGDGSPDTGGFLDLTKDSHNEPDRFKRGMLASALDTGKNLFDFDEILSWLADLKTKYELHVEKIPLKNVKNWLITDRQIHHQENKYFRILPVAVEIGNREVTRWTQPLLEPAQEGLSAFIVKKINDVYHFLVQAKVECGNLDILELAPTVQCLTGNYRDTKKGALPFLDDVLNATPGQVRFDTLQSEEGGRFFREQNRNMLIEVGDNFNETLPENYMWMTLEQLNTFLKFNNYLNIQSRSLLSTIDFI